MFALPGLKKMNTKPRLTTGLDLGSSSAKAVRLKCAGDSVELLDFEIGADVKNIAMLKDSKSVNISLSGPSVIIRYVSFPRMNAQELKNSLKFEAQKHIPFPVADLNLDSYVLRSELPDNKMLVLLVAVKKDVVNQRLEAMKHLGFSVGVIDIDSLALVNAFNFNYPEYGSVEKPQTVALLNIGAAMSNVSILEGDAPRFSRDVHVAGSNVTQKLMDSFGIDAPAAEELKSGSVPDDKKARVTAVLETVLTGLAGEVRTSFDFYESQSTSSVSRIFLSGGGIMMPEVPQMLKSLLGLEVEYWDPLKRIKLGPKIDAGKIKPLAAQLGVAVGLGLRS